MLVIRPVLLRVRTSAQTRPVLQEARLSKWAFLTRSYPPRQNRALPVPTQCGVRGMSKFLLSRRVSAVGSCYQGCSKLGFCRRSFLTGVASPAGSGTPGE